MSHNICGVRRVSPATTVTRLDTWPRAAPPRGGGPPVCCVDSRAISRGSVQASTASAVGSPHTGTSPALNPLSETSTATTVD
ncbi:hypothetical protein J4Q44_G00304460 [Coregonus suidteri]|uniref:Uncharacterized protein n=1 Tax=Coregonus suidteri TaxID=861788 RepID=A0AAN8L2S3_9TELE